MVQATEGNAFVPTGASVWEMGTNRDVKGKADEDYEKRSGNPLNVTPAETSYIFVTPRRWSNKEDWATARQAESIWKDVRAYDADDLEGWLEIAPSIHIWLSILLGKHPETAVDLLHFHESWTQVTNPPIQPNLLISGRNASVENLSHWLRATPTVLSLQGASREEAIAFFASAVALLPADEREHVYARSVVVENLVAWRRLVTAETPLILIPTFDEREVIAAATNQKHHVLIPLGKDEPASQLSIVLPRPHRESAKQALLEMGIAENKAEDLATLARQSLLALRRKLAVRPEALCPHWAKPDEARSLLPALLASKWVDSNASDQAIISALSRSPYAEVNAHLSRLANAADPPVRRTGETWLLISRAEAWSLLARFLTREDLGTFERVAIECLSQSDPYFGLSGVERMVAEFKTDSRPCSNLLREGLLETVVLMAANSDSNNWLDSTAGQTRADCIVWRLLHAASWQSWASLSHQLPLLAEASPTVFLEAVENGLSGEEPKLLNLFVESKDSIFGGHPNHTGLLWALELLAWRPDHLGCAALLLGKLARLDPNGRWANRPANSLREIFLGWHSQTTANLHQRLQVLSLLQQREPEITWTLLIALLPENHSTGTPTSRPRWREWGTDTPPSVTFGELREFAHEVGNRLLASVGMVGKKWSELLAAFARILPEQQQAIIAYASELEINGFTDEDRLLVWEQLRQVVSHHRAFPNAEWAMPSDVVSQLAELYERFTPSNLIDRYKWLFARRVDLPNPPNRLETNWQERDQLVEAERLSVVQLICQQGGLALCLELADKVNEPDLLGFTLGKSDLLNGKEDELLATCLAASPTQTLFALGFASGRFLRSGWQWAATKLTDSSFSQWSSEQKANFYLCLSFDSQTWDLLETRESKETQASYWSRVNPRYAPNIDYARVTTRLNEHRRPHFAIDWLALYAHGEKVKVPPTLIAETLEQLVVVTTEDQLQWGDIGYDIAILLGQIYQSGEIEEGRIARLEWFFMQLLEHYGGGPRFLHRELSRNSAFFVELIELTFRGENAEELQEDSDERSARATAALRLLHSWRLCPGSDGKGGVDREALRSWVNQARESLHQSGRGGIGDDQIGQALAAAPLGIDGVFPHEAVREIIEELANPEIEEAFRVRVFNNRGATVRGVTDGGTQETSLAESYFAQADKIKYSHPRTAAILRGMGENYLAHARREDASAELTQDLWR
ncbi:MAG TPA: hypothetical protein PLD20_17455 [Blastocatellia bacterium]|nr:hypothetical protein [Blastocatellia bacterium]HMX24317.1 hypothetical protein [Blastocatellia bacterium]HMZ19727.1 hypothetical protein [Blastocatellia bacterium]HNG33129.1 hypothetical protein [Blastocatellia bacterium]